MLLQTLLLQKSLSTYTRNKKILKKNESVKDMKYEDLQQKYDRMQEFYKNQIANLTKEVNHYKNLYHHILNNQGEDRKY